MAYYVGDVPAEDIVIEPARAEDEPLALAPFTAADTIVTLRTFEGDIVEDADFLVTFDEETVVLEWPATTVFEEPGLFTLSITLVNDTPGSEAQERLAPVYLVAQEEDGWHTLDSARAEWDDAPQQDIRLFQILELAKQQVLAYAKALEVDATIPTNYKHGQLMQARNLLNAGQADPSSGGIGDDSFILRPFPLDWMVKQVLRPKRGIPKVG